MGMSKNIIDREFQKFIEDEDGNTAVRVIPVENETDQQINVKLDEEYRLRVLNSLRGLNQTMVEIRELLRAIVSE
jgi:hypothetical protein